MLNIVSFNCHSIIKNIETVKQLLNRFDIVLLQELMLMEEDIAVVEQLHPDFNCTVGIKDKNVDGILTGRPSRGVAILFRKYLFRFIEPIKFDDRVIGIVLSNNSFKTVILNIYMPFDKRNNDSLHDFRSYLALIESILHDTDAENVIVEGDYNADPCKSRFWYDVEVFLNRNDLKLTLSCFSNNSFTYLCPATSAMSFIDHICISEGLVNKVSNFEILYNLALFDHFPVSFSLDFDFNLIPLESNFDDDGGDFINWDKLTKENLNEYQDNIDNVLENIDEVFDSSVFTCTNQSCQTHEHIQELDAIYNFIINVLLFSTANFVSFKPIFKQIAGWNDYIKTYYLDARNKFLLWKNNGKPRQSDCHKDMISSRRRFRHILSYCKLNEQNIRNNKLAQNLSTKNSKEFWKQVKRRKGNNSKLFAATKINDECDPSKIANMFSNYFKSIFADSS